MKLHCPCCGYPTLDQRPHEICAVCFWEDDPSDGGANRVTLAQARESFASFGACDEAARAHVRPPTDDEINGRVR